MVTNISTNEIPVDVRRILRDASQRYWAHEPTARPPLDDARVGKALFTYAEILELLDCRFLPLPDTALRLLATSPEQRKRRRRLWWRRVVNVVRIILKEELPDAIAYILGRKKP